MRLPELATTFLLILSIALPSQVFSAAQVSTCYGTPSKGSLKNGAVLPEQGKNFKPFTSLAVMLGRTYVHSTVKSVVVESYQELAKQFPDTIFMYGETGWQEGGKFAPHRTHKNGTSVDFMVPVLDRQGKSVPLPTSVFNKFGYNIEFDKNGKFENLTLDFEALAAHIYFLDKTARKHRVSLKRVLFDPILQPRLFQTKYGKRLKGKLKFNSKQAWVRHDEHIHVDFAIPCKKK
jgi:penicillin-insensitive murein endopeptidase